MIPKNLSKIKSFKLNFYSKYYFHSQKTLIRFQNLKDNNCKFFSNCITYYIS